MTANLAESYQETICKFNSVYRFGNDYYVLEDEPFLWSIKHDEVFLAYAFKLNKNPFHLKDNEKVTFSKQNGKYLVWPCYSDFRDRRADDAYDEENVYIMEHYPFHTKGKGVRIRLKESIKCYG